MKFAPVDSKARWLRNRRKMTATAWRLRWEFRHNIRNLLRPETDYTELSKALVAFCNEYNIMLKKPKLLPNPETEDQPDSQLENHSETYFASEKYRETIFTLLNNFNQEAVGPLVGTTISLCITNHVVPESEPNDAVTALCMSRHPRLGSESWMFSIDSEVLALIIEMSFSLVFEVK